MNNKNNNIIIAIDRQFGSGGLEIARKVAEYYKIACYDRELLAKTAQESGFTEELIQTQDEMPGSSFIFSLIADTFSEMPIHEDVFFAQQETIRKIARESENGFVMVGRCADVALRRHKNLIKIFIHAPESFRMDRIRAGKAGDNPEYKNQSDEKILELMRKKDKERWSYYDYYSQQRWGQAKNYDFTINSGLLGIDGSVSQILNIIDAFVKNGGEKQWMQKESRSS